LYLNILFLRQEAYYMLHLEELKKERKLVNLIDWDMTPEEAVRQYLEWGNNNWTGGKYAVRSENDVSYYFVVNTWNETPKVFLVKRNSEDTEELAEFEMPQNIKKKFYDYAGRFKGVFSVEGDVRAWLQDELDAA
jgi:hypothetical protein